MMFRGLSGESIRKTKEQNDNGRTTENLEEKEIEIIEIDSKEELVDILLEKYIKLTMKDKDKDKVNIKVKDNEK